MEGNALSGHRARKAQFEPKLQRQFERMEQRLRDRDGSCSVEVMGVVHDWDPGSAIVKAAKASQIVTLELTRNIVKAGLSDEGSRVLERNPFWNAIVAELRDGSAGRMVRGIEVNQTVRVAWKRLSLHYGYDTLAPAFFTMEVKDTKAKELDSMLKWNAISEEDISSLREHNWAIVESEKLSFAFMTRVSEVAKSLEPGTLRKVWPRPISQDFYLASYATKKPTDGIYLTTIMKEPHETLLKAKEAICEALKSAPVETTEEERTWASLGALESMLLSHAELKDAEEIFNCLHQRTLRNDEKETKLLHIGGSYHAETIAQLIAANVRDGSRVKVSTSPDPRFGPFDADASSITFFRSRIPFADRHAAVWAEGSETYADPETAASLARSAVESDPDGFERTVLMGRITAKEDERAETREGMTLLMEKIRGLQALETGELRARAAAQPRSPKGK